MAIESQIYEALKTSADLWALIGDNIFAVKIPQKTALPALTYQRVSGAPYNYMGGFGASLVRVRLDIWAKEYEQVKNIAGAAAKAVAAGADFVKEIENNGPDWADDNVYRTSLDIICWEQEGICYE